MWNPTEDIVKRKLKNHKGSASKRGIKCNLTLDDLMSMFTTNGGFCDYTGKEMCLCSEDTCEPSLVSLERINEYGDYSVDNLLLVRREANMIKGMVLESKSIHESKYKLTHDIKETINKICEVVYNPVKLKQVQSKYLDVQGKPSTKKDNIKVEESTKEIKTTNPEITLAQGYAGLGKLVESVSTFELTYAQYKGKMQYKKCELTGEKFNEGDVKSFWWVDKTKPFNKDNVMLTTKKLSEALDTFMVNGGLSLTTLKHLCKIVSLK